MKNRRPALALAALLALSVTLMGCSDPIERPISKTSPNAKPASLKLGVYGTAEELDAWESIVSDYNTGNLESQVELVRWRSQDEGHQVLDAAQDADDPALPDVYLASREDLDQIVDKNLNRPVGEFLDERGVDFGDRYSRDAVDAFSLNGDLQCMGYSISPTLMYLNTRLIKFEVMERRGLDTTQRWDRWTLDEFAAAASFGVRPARHGAGVHIEPTVEGLAPFILSGGGTLFDDPVEPTSLAFSSSESRDALDETLAVLRDASLTLTEEQMARQPALDWFKDGKLAMIAGQRDLVPELREVENLRFDVMPMPYLGAAATVGDAHGLCMSRATESPALAADLIAHLVGDEASAAVARAGATVPANLAVAGSEDFLQEDQMPATAMTFNSTVRGTVFPPRGVTWEELQTAVDPYIRQLLLDPGEIDLDEITTQIDEASRVVFNPETPAPSPTPSD